MRFAFINNFEQILAQSVSDGDTTITLDGGGSELDDASEDLVYVLTLFHVDSNGNETAREIVHVTSASGDVLTVERAKEGTTAQAWAVGDGVSQRLTAGAMNAGFVPMTGLVPPGYNGLAWGAGAQAVHENGAVAIGQADDDAGLAGALATAARAIALGAGSAAYASRGLALAGGEAQGDDSGAIGRGAVAQAEGSLALLGGVAYDPDSVAIGVGAEAYGVRALAMAGGRTSGEDAAAIGVGANATAERAVALMGATASGEDSVAWGEGAVSSGAGGVSVGALADAYGDNALAIGPSSSAGDDGVAIGPSATASYSSSFGPGLALGKNANAAAGTCAWGEDADAQAPAGMAAGKGASSMAPENVAYGAGAAVMTPYSVVLGAYARNANVPGGFQLNALSYLPASPDDTGNYAGPPPTATRRASQQVVIATDLLDLTDDTAAVTLDLPANTILLIDAIDVVIVGSDGAGGDPEIQVGPDDQDPADYLASTAVGKTAVGGRESHDPLVTDGVTSLRVATAVAGSGTEYQVKAVFRGYVMEL